MNECNHELKLENHNHKGKIMVRLQFLKSLFAIPFCMLSGKPKEKQSGWRTILIRQENCLGVRWKHGEFADAKKGDWVIFVEPNGDIWYPNIHLVKSICENDEGVWGIITEKSIYFIRHESFDINCGRKVD